MRIAWITRSFLDYRIPVFRELDRLVNGQLFLVFSGDYVPTRVVDKARSVLGNRAVALTGEWRLGREDREFMANRNLSLRYQPGIRKKIREIQPDVMVTDGFFKWTFPCLFERLIRKTPLVVCYERTAHTERRAQWYRTGYRKWAMKHIDAMCCNGRLCGEYTQSLGMSAVRITYGHMVADTDGLARDCEAVDEAAKQQLRRELGVSGLMVLYVGRLHELKGLRELLLAWDALTRGTPPTQGTLVLVGTGVQEEELKELANPDTVRFVGGVEYDAIHHYYAAADLFVIPTLEDNWSLVVPEAMACGLPVLCSRYNGCWPELVHEGENGWVFDPLDSRDFIRCLRRACGLGSQLRDMGRRSREIVSQFTPASAAQAILAACDIAVRPR